MTSKSAPAATPSVSAQGGEKLLERTKVEVEGDKLVIHPESSHGFFNFGWSHPGNAKFVDHRAALHGAAIAGSGDLRVDHVKGDRSKAASPGRAGSAVGLGRGPVAEAVDCRLGRGQGRRRQRQDRRI